MLDHLKKRDIISIGFMTFAFYIGAGNIIFPPLTGFYAGENIFLVSLGFLCTGVGLPLLTLLAVAKAGGDLTSMTKNTLPKLGIFLSMIVSLVIGPLFANPRTALVSYEMFIPVFGVNNDRDFLLLYSIIFYIFVTLAALKPSTLIDLIGKVLTPVFLILLCFVGFYSLLFPINSLQMPYIGWEENPFIRGFIDGYSTMDALASLLFGKLIIDLISARHVKDKKLLSKYIIYSGLITAVLMSLVYSSLFYLGAVNSSLFTDIEGINGAKLLSTYFQYSFGYAGILLQAVIMFLACFTTALGLTTSLANFFTQYTQKWGIGYVHWVFISGIVSVAVSYIGLTELMSWLVPVLLVLYPLTMILTVYSLINHYIGDTQYNIMIFVIIGAVNGLLNALFYLNLIPENMVNFLMTWLPLFKETLSWLPMLVIAIILILMSNCFRIKKV